MFIDFHVLFTRERGLSSYEYIEVEKIEIPSMMKLYVGDDKQLSAIIIPEDAINKHVKAMSYDESVITISQDLTLHPLKHGETIVKVTADESQVSADCIIKVFEHTTGVNIQKEIVIPINEHRQLSFETLPLKTSDGEILFSTSNDCIAQVDEKGNIKAIRRGSCTITATSVDGGYTATCEVTVTQPVEALALEKHSLTLKIGETERLYAQIAPLLAGNKKVNWSSADEEVARVDSMGTVKALAAGETWIMAASDDNPEAKDSCQIVVPDTPAPAPNGDCATPTIMVSGNKMTFECETPDAEFTSYLTTSEEFSGGEVVIENRDITFTLTVYAIAPGYDRSKPATMKFTVKKSDVNGDGHIDVADIATIIGEMAARARMQEETEE